MNIIHGMLSTSPLCNYSNRWVLYPMSIIHGIVRTYSNRWVLFPMYTDRKHASQKAVGVIHRRKLSSNNCIVYSVNYIACTPSVRLSIINPQATYHALSIIWYSK